MNKDAPSWPHTDLSRVLMIDDQHIVHEAVRIMLKDEDDISFHACDDPKSALKLASSIEPTVILLDLVMPGINGLVLLRFLRKHPTTERIPIIVLSSKEAPQQKAECFSSGANDYLVKPPEPTELKARIRYHTRAHTLFQQRERAYQALQESEYQLALSNQRLEDASRAKATFLANMSHEIRTPMNAIIGLAEILGDTTLSPTQSQHLQLIQTSCESLLSLLNDILDFSKIEAGKLVFEHINFSPEDLIEETCLLFAQQARQKGLHLICHLDPQLNTTLQGDPNRLRQILSNLLSNALKFTRKGQIYVRATFTHSPHQDHRTLRIQVTDTGIGIDLDKQDKLFDAFSQLDASTTRLYGGTGLGLAICDQLTRLMGGQMGFESTPNQGSTFWFTADLTTQADTQPDKGSDGDANGDHRPTDLSSFHILVIDPIQPSRLTLTEYIRSFGAQASGVPNVQQARRLLEAQPHTFHAVFFDRCFFGLPPWDSRPTQHNLRDDFFIHTLHDRTTLHPPNALLSLTRPIRRWTLLSLLKTLAGQPSSNSRHTHSTTNTTHPHTHTTDPSQQPPLILLAEDNATNQLVARIHLEKLGFLVDIVSNGQLAVERVQTRQYDFILMDCQMPYMDGYEATRLIRLLPPPTSNIPIIAMTAHAMEGARQTCIDAGMDDYISKPVRRQALQRILERWTPTTSTAATSTAATATAAAAATAAGPPPSEPSPTPGKPTPLSKPIWDPKPLDLLHELGGVELIEELLENFFQQLSTALPLVSDAFHNHDLITINRRAHSLRSSAGSIGGLQLMDLFARIEYATAEPHPPQNGVLVELIQQLPAAIEALHSQLSNSPHKTPDLHPTTTDPGSP